MLAHRLRRLTNIEPLLSGSRIYVKPQLNIYIISPATAGRWADVDLMLVQRRRPWPNINLTLDECVAIKLETLNQCVGNVGPASQTVAQQ